MYVEASSGNAFHLATFESPLLQQASATCIFKFWYHMFGRSIGELRVYIVTGTRYTLLWSLARDQGDQWIQSSVRLGRRNAPFKIVMEAERLYSSFGDIAIDDVTFDQCSLPLPQTTCPSSKYHCLNRACISNDRVCDLTDDCGDGSDEGRCDSYTR